MEFTLLCRQSHCSGDKVFALLTKYLERFLLHCSSAKSNALMQRVLSFCCAQKAIDIWNAPFNPLKRT